MLVILAPYFIQSAYRYGSRTPLSSPIHTACAGVTHRVHIGFSIFNVQRVSKHIESYQQNNLLVVHPVPNYLPGKAYFKLCLVDYVKLGLVR